MPNPYAPTIPTVAGQGTPGPQYDAYGRLITQQPSTGATRANPTGASMPDPSAYPSYLGSFVAHIATAAQIAKAASQLPPTPNPSGVFGARIQQPRIGAADLVMPMIPTR